MKWMICSLFLVCSMMLQSQIMVQSQRIIPKEKRGKWGYVDGKGKTVIAYQFEEAESFTHKLAQVKKNGLWGYIDEQGATVIPFQFEKADRFWYSCTCVRMNGKYGLIDRQGNFLAEPAFDSMSIIGNAVLFGKAGSFGLMDTLGKRLTEPVYQRIEAGWKNCHNVKKDGRWYKLDSMGETPADLGELVFNKVDEMPRFQSCDNQVLSKEELKKCSDEEMLKFLYFNIRYPEIARVHGIEGMVVVAFTVNSVGKLTDIEIVRDIGAECGAEARRVVEIMPGWIPGKLEGVPVGTRFNLPVKFKLK